MSKEKYKCKYCGRKMSEFDYKMNNGYCGKCREIIEWKRTLDHIKDLKK